MLGKILTKAQEHLRYRMTRVEVTHGGARNLP